MRDIEFRGKRKDNGEWVWGDLNHLAYGIVVINDNIIVNDRTVGQYTGIKDKNGVKIFEGDIVMDTDGNVAKVWFDFGCFFTLRGMATKHLRNVADDCEIIGTIYDNPELLKEASNG
jgi:hypothetical protein